jgi:hypothetical protein
MRRYELTYRDDSGHRIRETYRKLDAALSAGQALAAYGLTVHLRHLDGPHRSAPVRCMA